MRKWVLVVVALLVCAPMLYSADLWPFGKGKNYNLGSDPTIGGHHLLDDGLGFIRVDGYSASNSELTVTFLSGEVKLQPDRGVEEAMPCEVNKAVTLKPTQVCALWGKNDDERREYHIKVSWSYQEKKGVWIVMLNVKKATIKLAG